MDLSVGLPASISQAAHELGAVDVVVSDRLAVIAAADQVDNGAFKFDPGLAWHANSAPTRRRARNARDAKKSRTDPLTCFAM
jgi:hypothetical protein